ncbi:hypothetical protein LWC34_44740 [Kibdelosporangium philippinense]|uniref:Uncharacterized protein n=1 Tax=Kibdelosporangium philippinense TaxID=211113 RepID=A0ABS8ZTD3_9PSEU|nr:hypothetical protein [Kibdelosporangium philippinense]MCE7009866.1 hypothetical protein [Kibdelosporangium philippinense]
MIRTARQALVEAVLGAITESPEAILASRTMAGTLYANYYDLPPESFWATADFGDLCTSRAKEAGRASCAAVAGTETVIERGQILTTYNLATQVFELGLADRGEERGSRVAAGDLPTQLLPARAAVRPRGDSACDGLACLPRAVTSAKRHRRGTVQQSRHRQEGRSTVPRQLGRYALGHGALRQPTGPTGPDRIQR